MLLSSHFPIGFVSPQFVVSNQYYGYTWLITNSYTSYLQFNPLNHPKTRNKPTIAAMMSMLISISSSPLSSYSNYILLSIVILLLIPPTLPYTLPPPPPLRLYNTLTKSTTPFTPLSPDGIVKMYTCGPTVYAEAHLGNFRAFLTYDVLKRVLVKVYDKEVSVGGEGRAGRLARKLGSRKDAFTMS